MVDHHLTFADALVEAVARAGVYNKNDQAPPVAILWTDRERAWEPLAPILRVRLPLLTLGPYAPESRTGPAYWLRCMIARTLPEDLLPDDAIPVIYLPGVGKADLRAVDECPRALQPLAELQYRGVIWTHRNGRDWTPAAFVGSADGGLGVEIGADGATREALYRALPKLAAEPLDHMRRVAPLRAAYFDGLLIADEVRGILRWLNNPAGYQASDPAAWESFRALCRRAYGFDPARDGPLTAATLLGGRQGVWEVVWQRFVEAPHAYPNVPEMLRRGRPQGILPLMDADSPSSFPQDNEAAEASLRDSLRALSEALPLDARAEIDALEAAHGRRRYGVWATLGQAPLAVALEHLATLARVAERPLGGTTVDVIAAAYVEWAWQADGAVIDALAAVEEHAQVLAVGAAITAIYRPWLEAAAMALQRAVSVDDGRQSYQAGGPLTATTEPGTCVLFSDALRFDAARRLVTDLEQRGLACTVDWGLTALPGVTPTAKPAVAPLGADSGLHGGAGLEPAVTTAAGGTRAVDVKVLRRLLQDRGYQILLGEDDLGDPTGLGWTELGAIDSYGHANGWKLAHHLPGELRALARRVEALLKAGWRDIVLVTDHGWLLLPGGLPKVDLPEHLTAPRKGRCARLANGAAIDGQTVPWYCPQAAAPIPDIDLEWAVRLALECRRRVKEQQKRIGAAEFRNTHFSYSLEDDGVERFVTTPELQSDDTIGADPLPPGQIWAISPGGVDDNPALYRIDVTEGPGSGVRILNRPTPAPFGESVMYAEQNLYAMAHALIGEHDPRRHEFSVQLRAFGMAKSGEQLGLPALLALCGALLEKSLKGGLIVVGGLNLGGALDPVYNAVSVAELAIEKGASMLLIPVSARRHLNDLSDDMVTKIGIVYYADARDALLKALGD